MAIDKDPSIYRDRGTIGSSDELDEYGVWVKSEPQVLRAPAADVAAGMEYALPDIEDLPDLDLELPEDVSAPDIPDIPDILMDKPDELVPDFSDLPSFAMEEEPATEPASGDEDFSELSIDDFLDSTETPSGEVEAELAESPFDSIDLELSEEDTAEGSSDAEALKLEPVTDFDDFLNDLAVQSAPTPQILSAETLDGELDIDLGQEEAVSVELSVSEGLPEIEPLLADADERFDDVAAFSKDLEDREPPAKQPKPDLSTELLMRIAEELSSIKNELSLLKGELSVLRGVAKAEAQAPVTALPDALEEAAVPRGFFDEEEDETIALTGDELDNILNTADFTEEAGSDAGVEIETDTGTGMDFLSDKPDLLADEETAAAVPTIDDVVGTEEPETGIESIDFTEEGEGPADEDLPLELAVLRESGVLPMTPAPEDTSYLEEEQVDLKLLNPDEHLDLSDAVIEEPDLGDFTLEELHIEEPSIDSIDIDLDLEDKLQAEEIILPIDAKEESFEELIPEGFVVDSATDVPDLSSGTETAETVDLEFESELPESESAETESAALPQNLRQEVRAVLSYMDQLLESLPESKIEEFARSEYFDTYKKLFEELGIA